MAWQRIAPSHHHHHSLIESSRPAAVANLVPRGDPPCRDCPISQSGYIRPIPTPPAPAEAANCQSRNGTMRGDLHCNIARAFRRIAHGGQSRRISPVAGGRGTSEPARQAAKRVCTKGIGPTYDEVVHCKFSTARRNLVRKIACRVSCLAGRPDPPPSPACLGLPPLFNQRLTNAVFPSRVAPIPRFLMLLAVPWQAKSPKAATTCHEAAHRALIRSQYAHRTKELLAYHLGPVWYRLAIVYSPVHAFITDPVGY